MISLSRYDMRINGLINVRRHVSPSVFHAVPKKRKTRPLMTVTEICLKTMQCVAVSFKGTLGTSLKYLHFFTSDIIEESSIRARLWETGHREKRRVLGTTYFGYIFDLPQTPRLRAGSFDAPWSRQWITDPNSEHPKGTHPPVPLMCRDIICSEKRTVFRERSSRKTVSFEEQIMSKDKYPSIFSPQMETIVFIILQIFYATPAVRKLGDILGYPPVLAGGYSVTWRV